MNVKINGVRSASDFVNEIEKMVSDLKIDYLDAIMLYVSKNNIEVETVASMVKQNPTIKSKLFAECETLNLVEKQNKLPM